MADNDGVRDRPKNGKKVCLLSLSRIPDDPRVRRQGDALFEAGWVVAAVGQPGAKSQNPLWPCYHIENAVSGDAQAGVKVDVAVRPLSEGPRNDAILRTALRGTRGAIRLAARIKSRVGLALQTQMMRFDSKMALQTYWSWATIQELYQASTGVDADLWVANDWLTLPLAERLASERGGVVAYDTHEFAVNEYMERLKWRIFSRPLVKAIEGKYIREARVVSTVSEGIADELQRIYRLPFKPLVIRNVPRYESVPYIPESGRIRVLYHGIVAPVRGLEQLIRSVERWRPEFELTIRGPSNESYRSALHRLIESVGVSKRVTIAPPVPMTDLVSEAALFDVGFFCMPRLSKQHEYVLPNKLFEYIMAGLAVCVSDLPEMSRVVRATGVGVLLPTADHVDIANVMNGLSRESIRKFKARSREVARTLCWEHESQTLLSAYDDVIGK
ncbi:MAG: glycosyltransferase family 4 protein [Pseudolabrys sp.]|nr:glycosyltransferase family 4 protein [Pseudolabrys sp.]